jgi:transcriptional regulator with XRE-family HTH domain/Zn-dependent peptidase ImmA (M78 family)
MSEDLFLKQINNILKDSKHKKNLREIYEQRREQLDLSDTQIANVLKVDYNTIKRLLNKKAKKIDYLLLLKLSRFLNIEPNELANIYHEDDTERVTELGSVIKRTYLVENFDLKTLKKIGFIDSISNYELIEERIKTFFGLEKISDYDRLMAGVMFSKSKRTPHENMRKFWIASAYTMFEKIDNPNNYDRDKLVKLIPKIRPYTRNVDKGFLIVAQALYNAGVTVIYQPYQTNTQVRGGTFHVNGKPCIVITDYKKNYPTLWFALLHELHHVLYDLEAIKENNTYHLTGDDQPDIFLLEEDKANEFAREYLFSDSKAKYIKPLINNEHVVSRYAEKNEIHPSIIYAFYQWDKANQGHNFWGAYKKHFPDIERAVGDLNLVPWQKETIDEGVEELKETIMQI